MIWLSHHRAKILFVFFLLLSLPAVVHRTRETVDCVHKVGSASWSERALMFTRLRPCP